MGFTRLRRRIKNSLNYGRGEQANHVAEANSETRNLAPGTPGRYDNETTKPSDAYEHMCGRCAALPLAFEELQNAPPSSPLNQSRTNHPDTKENFVAFIDGLNPEICELCRLFDETASASDIPGRNFSLTIERCISALGASQLDVILRLTASGSGGGCGWISIIPAEVEDDASGAPDGLSISPQMPGVNWAMIKDCLRSCSTNHKEDCDRISRNWRPLPGLRVIDCTTRSVVPAPTRCKYVALSYVWGKSSDKSAASSYELPSWELMPLTIKDAIICTQALGRRYLWVDRYCIDQNDEETKHTTIQNMDQVYRVASLTIINAAGSGPNCGLPGVSAVQRLQQSTAFVRGQKFSMIPCGRTEIGQSKWSTRGWTYQEGLLARRRLIFTQSQVYFQCLKTLACEAIQTSFIVDKHGWTGKGRTGELLSQAMQPLPAFSHDRPRVHTRINEYVQRTLTYESDMLNAFMGILRQAWSLEDPTYHFWGLPFFPDSVRSDSLDSCFLNALTWCPKILAGPEFAALQRRQSFPSWSWAGWQGLSGVEMVQYQGFNSVLDGKVSFVTGRAEPIEIDDYIQLMQSSWNIYAFKPYITIVGWRTTVQLTEFVSTGVDRYTTCVNLTDTSGKMLGTADLMAAALPGTTYTSLAPGLEALCPAILFLPYNLSHQTQVQGLLLKSAGSKYERLGKVSNLIGSVTKDDTNIAQIEVITRKGKEQIVAKLECRRTMVKIL
ncbi:heterokaryon incompatibility protein-domain-containing protein [Paraphoma chrysanthemicola]|uniref:Heterokaryon incompatibility protein-domain-containing protein n=1 Tax=Paraphoma chrysanthemicola TaxID=798071 RepID=A0A8K0R3A2_9PLEO|nr:heterokaryon incompatibility protein-domain-containing protein [Paraphoma chrysanthemicola]